MSTPPPLRRALEDVRAGRLDAAALLPLVYADLKRLAAMHLSHLPAGQTLQPTALVHDAWFKLVGDEDPSWEGRRHFFGAASRAMRQLIIDQLRHRQAAKRQAPGVAAEPDSALAPAAVLPDLDDVLAVDEALGALEKTDAAAAEVAVLAFFGGLTFEEIAGVVSASTRTVERRWAFARAWLADALTKR